MAEASFGWDALRWAWNNRTEILGLVRGIREWWKSDPGRSILVIGCGGVGKTTLAAILSGEFDWLLSEPWRYNESYGVDESALKDDPKATLVIAPGQTSRRESAWADLERELAAGKFRGVIVVNANGYHSLPSQSYKTHPLYKGSKESFLTDSLQACRDDEIAVAKRVATATRSAPGKVWLLSLLAKEDLWWGSRQEAADFYMGGGYSAAIAEIVAAKGHQHFRHEVVTASLVINNFLSGEDEVLSKTVAGYDHRQQVGSLRRVFEVLNALREWEAL